jgi:hypothetical protein
MKKGQYIKLGSKDGKPYNYRLRHFMTGKLLCLGENKEKKIATLVLG